MLMRVLLITGSVLVVLSGPPSPVQAEARHSHASNDNAPVAVVEVERPRQAFDGGNQEQ
jgi:hypothetical protein